MGGGGCSPVGEVAVYTLQIIHYGTVFAITGKIQFLTLYCFSVGRVIPGIIKSTVGFVMDWNSLLRCGDVDLLVV